MYGSVSRWRIKEGKQDELEQLWNELTNEPTPGSLGVTIYHADADPREYWVCGRWESWEAYAANSATPEQDARFRRLRALMDGDPEWHDGEIITSN